MIPLQVRNHVLSIPYGSDVRSVHQPTTRDIPAESTPKNYKYIREFDNLCVFSFILVWLE